MKNTNSKILSCILVLSIIIGQFFIIPTKSVYAWTNPSNYPVPTRAIYLTSPTMKGNDVKYVQSILKELGYYTDSIDGSFGPGCKTATTKFQKDHSLDADGSVGPATLKHLQKVVTKYKQVSTVGSIEKSNAYNTYTDFFEKVDFTSYKNFVIPGLNTNMIPQGMCDIGNYALISAYDKSKELNSVIYVINKSTGKLTKTLYIKNNKTHVGGLAYDGTNIWIANSTKGTVGKISANTIISSSTKDRSVISPTNYSVKDASGKAITASFATYNNKILWVGTFNETSNSYAYGYSIGSSSLTLKHTIEIPNKIQGMTFDKNSNLILSQSYGRNTSSKILTYSKPAYGSAVNGVSSAKLGTAKNTLTAPPTSQNMFIGSDNLLYILFESAANYYYKGAGDNKAKTPVDRVCAIKIN